MTVHAPIPDFAPARRTMVDSQLRPQGVTDPATLAAMGSVARERFLPADVQPLAYGDRSLPLGNGRFLASPAVLGQLLTQIAPTPGERALVIGGGTGYSAAVLAHIGCEVVLLESDPELAALARDAGVTVAQGEFAGGHPELAPYDIILIDGAVDHIPEAIGAQLAVGGRIGAALAERGVTRLVVGRKAAAGVGYSSIADAGVASLPGFSRPREFTF